MKVTGIIAEYDPFHNGHRYQLERAVEMSGADAVVVVMSGSFTQRGTPAFYDKMARTHAALMNGADLIIELPYIYACNAGSEFARGGVGILERLGVVTDLAFGSECGDLDQLAEIAAVTSEMSDEAPFVSELRRLTGTGLPYPMAVCRAVSAVCGQRYGNILKSPNNVLGIEYLRALDRQESEIVPHCIVRRGAAHGEERILPFSPAAGKSGKRDVSEQSYQFASASALRKILRESGESGGQKEAGKAAGEYIGKIAAYLPPESAEIFRKEPFFCDMQKMYRLLRYRLLTSDPEHLRTVYTVSEGIENRLKRAASVAESWEEFLEEAGTKRYTEARIRRMAAHILMDLTGEQYRSLRDTFYARVLGFSETGGKLLRLIRRKGKTEVISNLSGISHLEEKTASALSWDKKAADLRNLLAGRPLRTFSDRRIVPLRISRRNRTEKPEAGGTDKADGAEK